MTATTTPQRSAHPVGCDAGTHIFEIGQTVRLKGGYGVSASRFGDIYRVTGTLPARGDSLQYRIRNDGERHERVTTEDSLERVLDAPSNEGPTLRELTFGKG